MFFGLAPDRNWLAFMHSLNQQQFPLRAAPQGDAGAHVFDPQGDFILRYGQRGKDFESQTGLSTGP